MAVFVAGRSDLARYKVSIFALSIFLSAFLIFSIQPLFTKIVLPVLGGTPAVWSVAMVVFQGLLLAGYLYAHLLIRFLSLKMAILVHLAVTVLALTLLPFDVTPQWGEPPQSLQALWLITIFLSSIGLPFFALAANAPLLQAWLAANHRELNVYHLYAASNVGSFLALFAYPFVIEPLMGLRSQSLAWTLGFTIFIGLLMACGALVWRSHQRPSVKAERVSALSWTRRFVWLIYAAIPSGLLIAATAHIQTDVSGIALLWVLPLSLYLLSFILAFRDGAEPNIAWSKMVRYGAIFILVATALQLHQFFIVLALGLFIVLSVSMTCHAHLYRLRPAEQHLTEFYLFLSLGGFIGGLFTSLMAPHLFSWNAEYIILVLFAVLAIEMGSAQKRSHDRAVAIGFSGLIALALAVMMFGPADTILLKPLLVMTAVALIMLNHHKMRPYVQGACVATILALLILPFGQDTQRGFFGVLRITETADGSHRTLMHGSTLHGAQAIHYEGAPEPLTYYTRDGAIGRSLTAVRQSHGHNGLRIGVVGLGVGSMACLKQGHELWSFYEIDPLIVSLAKDQERFQFLSQCGPDMRIVLGDARLTLTKEPNHAFDYLLIDAFSSDAIPVHLVTFEAISSYLDRLSPDGLLALHISNRYVNLAPILARIARAKGFDLYALELKASEEEQKRMQFGASVVAIAKSEKTASSLRDKGYRRIEASPDQMLWTDHYTNVPGELVRGALRRWFGI